MTLQLKHFDTHTGDWIKDPTNNDQILTEKLTGSLLEAYFPGVEFSIGHMDETTTAKELVENHPQEHRLFLATPSGILIYAPEKNLRLIEEVLPDKTHRVAYCSVFKGECKNIIEQSLSNDTSNRYSILIVDDKTGKNGEFLPAEVAFKLIDDGHGKSSKLIAEAMNSEKCLVQFRLGLLEMKMQAKGALAPIAMEELPWNGDKKADLIIPISCFKGNKPEPGLYTTDFWLGEKNRSQEGKIAMSSLIPFYTEGLRDVLPTLDANAQKLAQQQNNLSELAELYCQRYEQRKKQTVERWQKDESVEETEETEDLEFVESGIYQAIRAAIDSGDPSMLEMAPIVKELQDFTAKSWKQIAIGKDADLSWDRAMIMPSKNLQQGLVKENVSVGGVVYDRPKGAPLRDRLIVSEICDYSYPEGEIFLEYRAPVYDKDNVGVAINKHLSECLGLDGKPLVGVIAISPQSWEMIHQRVDLEINTVAENLLIEGELDLHSIKLQSLNLVIKELKPEYSPLTITDEINLTKVKEIAQTYDLDERTTERNYLNKCLDSLSEKGVDLKLIVPEQTVCERQASDFDGDCIGLIPARKFPHIFAETVKQAKPENRREPVVKFEKELFDAKLSFEEIVIEMYNPPVGLISYSGTTLKSLRSELEMIQQHGSLKDQGDYLLQVAQSASNKLYQSKKALSKGEADPIPSQVRPQIVELASYKKQDLSNLSQEKLDRGFELYFSLLGAGISLVDQENQVAVDGMKSARKPDMETVDLQRNTAHRSVTVISQKKQHGIYAQKPIQPESGCSPLELTAANTNVYWEKAQLEPRSLEQFKDLFPQNYSSDQLSLAAKAKLAYDQAFVVATKHALKERHEEGAFLIVSDGEREIPITNLKDFQHQDAYSRELLQIKLTVVDSEEKDYHKLLAYAAPIGETHPNWQPLGTVCEIARENLDLQPGYTFNAASVSLHNPVKMSDIFFEQAREIATNFRESIPQEERRAIAAAVGHLCTTREDGKSKSQPPKNSRFMFAAFPEETAAFIREPAITNFLTKVRSDTETVNVPRNETVTFQVGTLPNGNNRTLDVLTSDDQFRPFATLLEDSPQLVVGTKVQGQIVGSLNTTFKLQADIPGLAGKDLFFGKVDQHDLAKGDVDLNGKKVRVTLKEEKIKTPTFILSNNGVMVGTLTPESVDKLREKNCLTMGKSFELSAQTTGRDYSTRITLTSPSGNSLKLTGINPTTPRFQGDKVKFTLSQRTKESSLTKVHLEIDGKSYCAGEFTTSTSSKASVALLKEAGLFGDGKTFSALVFSPDSLVQIKIDRNTLNCPEVPPSASCLLPPASLTNRQQKLLDELKSNPPLLSRTQEPWQQQDGTVISLPTLHLAVDKIKADRIIDDLQNKGANPNIIDALNPAVREETKRGYVVLRLLEEDTPERVKKKLLQQLGEPIVRQINDTEYNHILQNIPKKPGKTLPSVDLSGLRKFLDSQTDVDVGLSIKFLDSKPEMDLSTSVFLETLKPSEDIQILINSVKKQFGGQGKVELYDLENGDDGKLLTFTFKTEAGRTRAAEELGLPLFFDRYKSFCAAVPLEEAEKFMQASLVFEPPQRVVIRESPPLNTENLKTELQAVEDTTRNTKKVAQDLTDFSLDNLINNQDKIMINEIDYVKQQERTNEIAPILTLHLGMEKSTHQEGKKFIIDYDKEQRLLSLTDKESQLPVMLAKPLGKDVNGDIVWESQPLPDGSPGLTPDTVEVFRKLKESIVEAATKAEEYIQKMEETKKKMSQQR